MKGRNRGQVIPKGDNQWLLRVHVGNHKYVSKQVTGTSAQAQKALTAMLGSADRQDLAPQTKQTVEKFFTAWLKARTDVEDSTLRFYEERLKLYIVPALGAVRMDRVSAMLLSAQYAKWAETLAPRSVRHIHRILHAGFEQAVEWGQLTKNPAKYAIVPMVQHEEAQVHTPEQVHLLLERAAEHPRAALFLMMLSTGLRIGEVCALKWSDFNDGAVRVVRAWKRGRENRYYIGDLKKKRQRRTIPISTDVSTALDLHRKQQVQTILSAGEQYDREGNFVFADEHGVPLTQGAVRASWKTLCKKAKVPYIRPYSARHSHATILLDGKVSINAVSERLGHSSKAFTMDTYQHVLPHMQDEAVVAFDEVIKKAASQK